MHSDSFPPMPYSASQEREALLRFMNIHSLSARALCKAAGLSPSALSQFLKGRVHSLKSSTYDALSVGAGRLLGRPIPVAELRGDTEMTHGRSAQLHIQGNVRSAAGERTIPHKQDMERTLPFWGTVSGGPGAFQMGDSGLGMALRPRKLEGREDVGAFWVEDSSMLPAHRPGSMIVAEKRRPPAVGDDVVFELLPESQRDDRRALIKRLVSRSNGTLKVEQFNPPKVLEFPMKRVANLMRVMPLAELLDA